MANYTNEVVDILLILDECHRNYRNASRLYAECCHPNPWQVIDIIDRKKITSKSTSSTETTESKH